MSVMLSAPMEINGCYKIKDISIENINLKAPIVTKVVTGIAQLVT